MRKIRYKLLIVLIILSSATAYGASYTLTSANYPINVNGQKLAVEPLNMNGTTYLPLRSISEAVGVPIAWDNAKRSVEINTVDVEKLKQACVMIYADDGKMQSQGSGVYVDYDEILTANHVVDKMSNFKTLSGTQLSILKTDKNVDAAVLKSQVQVKPVKIGDSDEVKVGDKVIIISSPKGKFNTVLYANVEEPVYSGMVLWCDATKGSSGGAVFNLNGELIGIIISGSGTDKACLAKPINDIRKAL